MKSDSDDRERRRDGGGGGGGEMESDLGERRKDRRIKDGGRE